MALSFTDLMAQPALVGLKTVFISLLQANAFPATSFVPGDPSERWVDITPRMVFAVLAGVTTQAVRGFFFAFATDPGDPGDLSQDQTPRAGFLSALGQGWYGVTRGGQTYATCTVVLKNTGLTNATFAPFQLTFTGSATKPDGGNATYRNVAAPSIYTGLGGTLTLAPGAQATLPVMAEQIGTYGTASANSLSCTTQSFGTLTVQSSTLATGQAREARALYIARCQEAAAVLAHGGPGAAYQYAATTASDGTPLQRWDGSGPVSITRVYVSPASATGNVTVYVAGALGAASAGLNSNDVSAATANICGLISGAITSPIGVLPDGVTIGPTSNDPNILPANTPGCALASEAVIAVTYSVKMRVRDVPGFASPGTYNTPGTGNIKAVFDAIASNVQAVIPGRGIGGDDQVAGAGVIWTPDIQDAIKDATVVAPGSAAPTPLVLRDAVVTLPAGASTPVAAGAIGVAGTITGQLVVTP